MAGRKVDTESISFFSEVDLRNDGKPASEYPSWFFDIHIAEMKENIERKKRQLDRGLVHPEMIMRVRMEVQNEEKRLKELEGSKPRLTKGQKDVVYREYQKLADQLSESMPTRREDRQGFVRPHEELKRLNTAYIDIDPNVAAACGLGKRTKITGKQAAKCYQIMGKALGEDANVEKLRKDGGVESFKTMDSVTAKIFQRLMEGEKRIEGEGL